jgi:hypothetical protein
MKATRYSRSRVDDTLLELQVIGKILKEGLLARLSMRGRVGFHPIGGISLTLPGLRLHIQQQWGIHFVLTISGSSPFSPGQSEGVWN